MKEANLRKYHRYMGVSIALLVVFQVSTGLILSLNLMTGSNFLNAALTFLHFGGGIIGNVYRILLATTLLFMVTTGVWVFMKILARSAGAPPKRAAGPSAKPGTSNEQAASPR